MKGYQSVLFDESGRPFSEQQEMAHVLAHTNADIGKEFMAKARGRRMWGWILIFTVVLSPIGIGLLIWSYVSRPKVSVTRVGKGWWVAAFHDFEGGKVLVDKSQLTQSVSFLVPVPGMRPEEMSRIAQQAKTLVDQPPILASRESGEGPIQLWAEGGRKRDPRDDLVEQMRTFGNVLEQGRDLSVRMNVLAATAPITQAILRDASSGSAIQPRNPLVSVESQEVEKELKQLAHLTSVAGETTQYSTSVEELAEWVTGELEATVNSLDQIQRTSLVEVLQRLLTDLERAYRAPMLLYYCPSCLGSAAKEIKMDLDRTLAGAIEDGERVVQEGVGESLAETVERFGTTSRAAVMRLEWRMRTPQGPERHWRCPLCNRYYPLGDVGIILAYRAKQELVLPLWDQLWVELSTERAGLLERKDKEQRDNIQHEHQETVQAADEFHAERRQIKNRMEILDDRTITAVNMFSSLIESFVDAQLVNPMAVTGEKRMLEGYRKEYEAKLDEIDRQIADIERELNETCEESLERRKPIVDFADEVKMRSQFMSRQEKPEEEIVLEG